MRFVRRAIITTGLVLTPVVVSPVLPSADADPTWAPAGSAPIHPGVNTNTAGGSCTSNFVFFEGSTVYIGQAAHCASLGGPTDLDGCTTPSQPLDTPVEVDGATEPGVLAYSSWIAMQQAGETDPGLCNGNDFALVRLDAADWGRVNPSVPVWGGPTGIDPNGVATLEQVFAYGNSILKQGISQLAPQRGVAVQSVNGGRTHEVLVVLPGVPGDSGSAYLSSTGEAVGVLSYIGLLPTPLVNGVADVRSAVDYMRSHSNLSGVQLAAGTVPFNAGRIGLLGL